jgi:hypothetical protein
MKKIENMQKLLAIALVALAAGCVRGVVEPDPQPDPDPQKSSLAVSFAIPDARVTRAAIEPGQIASLWVMVFSEAGTYLSRHAGEADAAAGFSKTLFREIPISDRPRTLHFVAHGDWSSFVDADWTGRAENAVLAALTVGTTGEGDPAPTAYWQRLELPGGIEQTAIVDDRPVMRLEDPVHLLRNVARITVVNDTASDPGNTLTEVAFAVGDRYDRGTVAPYDPASGTFGAGNDDIVTQAAGGRAVAIVEATDFEPESGAIEMYERRNHDATDNSYLIIRGRFNEAAEPSYYKVVLTDESGNTLLDIGRNRIYNVTITSVKDEGHPSLDAAVRGLPSNNVTASVVASEYTDISDDSGVLHVDATDVTYVAAGRPFSIGYFFRTAGGVIDYNVNVSLSETNGDPVDGNVTAMNGVITGTTGPALPVNDIYRAVITITRGDLSRTIDLQLRPPMNFTVEAVPAAGGAQPALRITFPADISPRLFPLPVRIYTKRYSPAPGQGLAIEVDDATGEYYYLYNAPYMVRTVGNETTPLPHTITLTPVPPAAATAETIRVASALFNDNTQAVFP